MNLKDYPNNLFLPEEIMLQFLGLINSNKFTEEENPQNHIVVYFMPYNPQSRKFYLVKNERVNLYLFPGGHQDKDETPEQTAVREIQEELGCVVKKEELVGPVAVTKTLATNPKRACITHYDIWYLFNTPGNFQKPGEEVSNTQWLTINEAIKLVSNPATSLVLKKLSYEQY